MVETGVSWLAGFAPGLEGSRDSDLPSLIDCKAGKIDMNETTTTYKPQ